MAQKSHRAGDAPLLRIDELRTHFFTDRGVIPAVDGVSCEVHPGRTLGIVGESGSGKSVMALSVLGLVPQPGRIVGGEIWFESRDITKLSEPELRRIRGNDISMIFQEPAACLNPVYSVGNQIIEAIMLHQDLEYPGARELAVEMLRKVGIPEPDRRIDTYPHEMSGGMKQRVMIAMALACRPKLLIADEPTTALDVTIQAQILELLAQLQATEGMSMMFITHNLSLVAEVCDQVAVMYAGKVVESADVITLFEKPAHPYTLGLFRSMPVIEKEAVATESAGEMDSTRPTGRKRLEVIRGMAPRPQDYPPGCRFMSRCDSATDKCAEQPPLVEVAPPTAEGGHLAACWYAGGARPMDPLAARQVGDRELR